MMEEKKDQVSELKDRIRYLEQQNKTLARIIHKTPIPVFVIDRDHTITHFNEALEELSGLRAIDMIGTKDQWKAFYKTPRPVMADLIIDQSSDEKIVQYYGPKYDPSKKKNNLFAATDFFKDLGDEGRWLFFTAAVFSNDRDAIDGAVETLQDVTEEKTAERRMRETYRVYRKILEFIPYPVVVYDDQGFVSFSNLAFADTFGWSFEEIKGRHVPFVPQNLREETVQILEEFRHTKSLQRYETKRLTKDGRLLDVVLWATAHSSDRGKGPQNFVLLRNVTEEKRLAANNKTIMRISAVLPEYPELEELMTYISKEVKALLDTEGAVVLLYDEIKEELFFTGGSYDDSETDKRAKKFRFPADSILAGEIIKTGEYALVNDAAHLAEQYPGRDHLLGYKTRNLLEVPIKSEDRIIGVLCAINKKQNPFDYNDMELMTMIAATCAISIENARFSEAVRETYRDMASMNRARGKAINHLSHELKTPVAVLSGSLQILKNKLAAAPDIRVDATLKRLERNLNRIVEIQKEVADIMDGRTYAAKDILLNLYAACKDELATILQANLSAGNLEDAVLNMIDELFGSKELSFEPINLSTFLESLFESLKPQFKSRKIDINVSTVHTTERLLLPGEIIGKMMTGIIRNAVENTPDHSRIDISLTREENGFLFEVHDFGVGIETDDQKRIFEGFFSTQETLNYSTKTPFSFNAGGKGADLLRMKIFSRRHGFDLKMNSKRCRFLEKNPDIDCPGDITKCEFCSASADCINSGHSIFSIFFPLAQNYIKNL